MNESESTTCPYCGDVMSNPRRVQCGRPECRRAYRNERARRWNAEHPGYRAKYPRNNAVHEHVCEACGVEFKSHKREQRTCSAECHSERCRRRHMQLIPHPGPFTVLPESHPARQPEQKLRRFVACVCIICGTHFIAPAVRHATCGDPRCDEQKRKAERRSRKAYERTLSRGGRPGVFSASQWGARLREYGRRCAYCGAPDSIEIEHVIPLGQGGANSIANIVPACSACNRDKGARTPEEWKASDTDHVRSLDDSCWPRGARRIGSTR